MSFSREFLGWESLTLSDLFVAYRKAKADSFFESTFPSSIAFSNYEESLLKNLESLLFELQNGQGFLEIKNIIGECRIVPKGIKTEPLTEVSNGHAHFSEPNRAFQYLIKTNNLIPEFRIIGDLTVNTHIVSALWINLIGHKFDSILDSSVYGARLKRVQDVDSKEQLHLTSVTSFRSYFTYYQKWRNDGLNTIRKEVEGGRSVIAVSLDLKSYYHLIDPSFLVSAEFLKSTGLGKESDGGLTKEELDFTTQLTKLLSRWSEKSSELSQALQETSKSNIKGGLCIGLTASRVISNLLLHKWDRLVREKLTPIYYGRYVDDMFLVFHDPGDIYDMPSFMAYLQNRLGKDIVKPQGKKKDAWQIDLGKSYQKKSKIILQSKKQKLFLLEGQGGLDLLDCIAQEISALSSEHRLMPEPDKLEHSTAARALAASEKVGEKADTLRKADGLTIKRLSWSLQLRHVETLSNDLPSREWKKEREEFYLFAHNHILRPDKIFSYYEYLPRLLGFAIKQNDWNHAERIISSSYDSLEQLKKHNKKTILNGVECEVATDQIFCFIKTSLSLAFIDAAARYFPTKQLLNTEPSAQVLRIHKLVSDPFLDITCAFHPLYKMLSCSNVKPFYTEAINVLMSDLASIPYKNIPKIIFKKCRDSMTASSWNGRGIERKYRSTDLVDVEKLNDFLKRTKEMRIGKKNKKRIFTPITPYLFPTRPYSPSEIAELIPECVGLNNSTGISPDSLWAGYVSAIRGVWVKPSLLENSAQSAQSNNKKTHQIKIGTGKSKSVLIGITNIKTDNESWEASAFGKPSLTMERYKRLCSIVNQAIKLYPRPKYFLLPELSLPNEWLDSVSNRLLSAGISLIAGTEYIHDDKNGIYSEACLSLIDNRLGYPSSVRIRQPKSLPAPEEDKVLISKFGKYWKDSKAPNIVYNHDGFHFGVMVCSELQNSKARINFQGEVDALIILSWNQDLETFASLIEATALDVHAYTVLVNNREFGDSRVRSPSKERFLRDLARLRGGNNDFCVTVEIDIEKLKAFQSRKKRWPDNNDPFKPVPEGYTISGSRKRRPK